MGDFNLEARQLLQAGFRYACSLVHREQDAEDLVQEAWLRLYQSRGEDINQKLLFVAIRNLFIDQYRRGKCLVFEVLDETQLLRSPNRRESETTAMELDTALQHLRAEEREAIFLNVVEGYTAKEIAGFMSCPRGTVLSLIHRGKRKLYQLLADVTQDQERQADEFR